VALFGQKLRESPVVKNYTWAELQTLTTQVIDAAQPLQVEFSQLVAQAAQYYAPKKKKQRKKESDY
jgi:hypothetical protein